MKGVFGTTYNINLSEINGIPLNDLIDRGLRFSIATNDSELIQFISEDIDDNDEDFIHV